MCVIPLATRLLVASLVGLCFLPRLSALENITDGASQRVEYVRAVRQLFVDEDFARLEKIADKLRQEKSRFPEGLCKLQCFYLAFGVESTKRAKIDWDQWLSRLERWEQKFPESITARIAHAGALISYAWEARGGGWADTVSAQGWQLFADRLKYARSILEAIPAAKTCPGYYAEMMTIALGQSWSRAEYEKLFAEAVALAPDYEDFYFRKVYFLQEKWYGQPREWLRFAEEAAATTAATLGETMYARLVWATVPPPDVQRFQAANIDWPKLRQAFEDLIQRTPASLWNKNAYCFYAYAAGDHDTARRLMNQLNGRYAAEIWQNETLFKQVEDWVRK